MLSRSHVAPAKEHTWQWPVTTTLKLKTWAVQRKPIVAGKRLTDKGPIAVAIRQNLANIAQQHLGVLILEELSGQPISRCEVECGAAIVAAARSEHEAMWHKRAR